MRPDVLAQHIAAAIHSMVLPLRDQVTQLHARVAGLEASGAQQAETIRALQDSNKALGKLITRSLDVPRHAPCLDDLTDGSAKH